MKFHPNPKISMNILSVINAVKPTEVSLNNGSADITDLCIDSRKLRNPQGTLFFAIETYKNDGRRYIPELIRNGVRNFIFSGSLALDNPEVFGGALNECNFLQVSDVYQAINDVASAHRRQYRYPVIGVAGSNGKTVVKEWLAMVLDEDFNIVRSPDSYNSQLGVPLSVWLMSAENNLAIFEAGISQPGEMSRLADTVRADIGILTNIGMAHAQFFSSTKEKAVEKLELFKYAHALIYRDNNAELNGILRQPEYGHLQKVSWGSRLAAYPVEQHAEENGTSLILNGYTYHIPFVDAASVEDATHVIVAALHLGLPPQRIEERLRKLSAVSMRMEILEGINHSVVINDTYSLDFNALSAALSFMDTQTQLPHKTVVISDFEQASVDYGQLDKLLAAHHVNRLIAVGPDFSRHQKSLTFRNCLFFGNTETLLEEMPCFSYETILVKGARSFHFERVVNRLQKKTHLTILNVSLPALAHNLEYHRSLLDAGTKMVAMVKASSYGLGDVELVNELIHHRIDYLAVAYTDEGVRLRRRHVHTPIIVLGAEAHSFDMMVRENLEPEIFNFYYLHELENVLKKYPHIKSFNIHIKLDTGMHRLGFDEQDLPELIRIVRQNRQLHIASVFSHLAAAEDPGEDAYTHHQIELFRRMSERLCRAFDYKILRHILNSAGICRFREAQFDMVRLGISLYGCSELDEVAQHLHNVATLKTVITQVKTIPAGETIGYNRSYVLRRDTPVAIIPIGYADGYPRELGNGKGSVIVQSHKVPVIGKVCMDMCMLDVTGLNVHEGDEVIVYGEGNSVSDMAKAAGLISYELLTRISRRVPRVYVNE